MRWNSVDLPAPFGPMTPDQLAVVDANATPGRPPPRPRSGASDPCASSSTELRAIRRLDYWPAVASWSALRPAGTNWPSLMTDITLVESGMPACFCGVNV